MLRSILTSTGDFSRALLNLLYPQNCLVCNHKINDLRPSAVCGNCSDKIRIKANAAPVENSGNFAFDRAFYAADYDDVVKKCICLFKYEGKTQMLEPLGKLMTDFAYGNPAIKETDFIIPVPLHPVRLRERQFNQSELLAGHLARYLNKNMVKDGVKRIKYTAPQTGLKREERLRNLKGAFLVKKGSGFEGKSVLLVDDVLTTGATLHECAKALKAAGAKKVLAFTLARGN